MKIHNKIYPTAFTTFPNFYRKVRLVWSFFTYTGAHFGKTLGTIFKNNSDDRQRSEIGPDTVLH